MTVSTDKKRIDSLLTRRVVEVVVEKSLRDKLASGRKLRVKFGADPTSSDLHIGHAVALRKLKEFQDLGHQIVFIIGDYTARVGDPSGKSKTRPMLSDAEVKANAKTYFEQVGKILDVKKMEIRWNGEWFAKMDFADILKLTSQFTVARMIERDDFAKRLKAGTDIHVHELLYPAMQAYDSIMVDADVEIGGTDQRFNILAGRDLQRKMGKPEQDCLFLGPILMGTDGTRKMSKSYGNYVGVSDTPEEMFGKVMSIPDTLIWDWFTLTTDVPDADIVAWKDGCEKGELNPRDAKARLAKAIITIYHSPEAADKAEEHFKKVFQKKEIPDLDEIPEATTAAFYGGTSKQLIQLLVEAKLVVSKSEARRVIEGGGIKVDGVVISDINHSIRPPEEGINHILIQKGKRHFVKVPIYHH